MSIFTAFVVLSGRGLRTPVVVTWDQQALARGGLDINNTRATKEKPREGARRAIGHITPADL